MMKSFYSAAAIAVLLLATSCGDNTKSLDSLVEGVPVMTERDGNWSFMNREGKFVYADEFKSEPSPIINGYFYVEEGDNVVVYRAGDKPVPVANCDELAAAGYMSDGLMPVTPKKSRITVVDGDGKAKFELMPVKGKEIVSANCRYVDGMLAVVDEDNMYGYVDKKGEAVIVPQYEYARDFSEGLAIVVKDEQNYAIDKKGETVIKFNKDWSILSSFNYGVTYGFDQNEHAIFIDKKGEADKCPSKVKYIVNYNKDYYIFGSDNGVGVAKRKDHEVVIRAKYNNITFVGADKFACYSDKKVEIRTAADDVVATIDDFRSVYALLDYGFIGEDKNTSYYIDNEGKNVKGAEFYRYVGYVPESMVTSQYFNYEAMAQAAVGKYTAQGFGDYKYGSAPSDNFENAKDYTYKYSADVASGSGVGYDYSTSAVFTAAMANYDRTFVYSTFSYQTKYYWNPAAKISGFSTKVSVYAEDGEDCVKALARVLEGNGFKQVASNNNDDKIRSILQAENTVVVITNFKGNHDIYVTGDHFDSVDQANQFVENEK